MPLFIALGHFTDEGAKNIKEFPARLQAVATNLPEGVKLHGMYVTQGRYDLVTIAEAPDVEAAIKFSAEISARGLTRWETLSAITADRFAELLKS